MSLAQCESMFRLGDAEDMFHAPDHKHTVGNCRGPHDYLADGICGDKLILRPSLYNMYFTIFARQIDSAIGSDGRGTVRAAFAGNPLLINPVAGPDVICRQLVSG